MKLLRLSLFTLLGLAVATVLAAPGFIGPKVEQVWKQQLSRLQGGSIADYRRGWFGAETSIEVQGAEGPTRLHSDIQHGPLLFTARGPRLGAVYSETRLSLEQLAPQLRAQLEQFYGRLDHSPLVLESLVGADNRVVNRLRLEPFTRSESNGELTFDGGEVLLNTDYTGSLVTGTLAMGSLRHSRGGQEKLYTEPVGGEFEFVPGEGGEATITLPLLRAESDSGPLELRDISLQLSLEQLAGGALKLVSQLQLPEVQSATPVTSVWQQLTLPRVSAADLGHYLRSLPDWTQTVQRPLQLQQQLAVESHNGPVLLDADIDWRGGRPQSGNLNSWLQPLSGSMTFSAAEQAVLQSPAVGQAMMLRQYGLLLEKDGELQMHLQVDRGQLRVNGLDLPVDLFVLALTGKFQ